MSKSDKQKETEFEGIQNFLHKNKIPVTDQELRELLHVISILTTTEQGNKKDKLKENYLHRFNSIINEIPKSSPIEDELEKILIPIIKTASSPEKSDDLCYLTKEFIRSRDVKQVLSGAVSGMANESPKVAMLREHVPAMKKLFHKNNITFDEGEFDKMMQDTATLCFNVTNGEFQERDEKLMHTYFKGLERIANNIAEASKKAPDSEVIPRLCTQLQIFMMNRIPNLVGNVGNEGISKKFGWLITATEDILNGKPIDDNFLTNIKLHWKEHEMPEDEIDHNKKNVKSFPVPPTPTQARPKVNSNPGLAR